MKLFQIKWNKEMENNMKTHKYRSHLFIGIPVSRGLCNLIVYIHNTRSLPLPCHRLMPWLLAFKCVV